MLGEIRGEDDCVSEIRRFELELEFGVGVGVDKNWAILSSGDFVVSPAEVARAI